MSDRATAWSLTINNPTAADEEEIALARQRGWKVEGQLEKGSEGTLHYQLLLRTPQIRFSAVKKAFSRAHIEIARNVSALQSYVHKQESAVAELPTTSDKYPSLSKFWELLFDQFRVAGVLNVYPAHGSGEYRSLPTCDWSPSSTDPTYEYEMAVANLIMEGYHVETLAVNPQNISAFRKFAIPLMIRVLRSRFPTQTDRQTDTNENGFTHKPADSDITPNVSIPTTSSP